MVALEGPISTLAGVESVVNKENMTLIEKPRYIVVGLAFAAISILLFSQFAIAISSTNVSILNQWSTVDAYDYIVFTDGTTTYAKNGVTGAVDYSGSNAFSVIQQAINASAHSVFIRNDGVIYTGSTEIIIEKSNYKLLSNGATLKLNTGAAQGQLLHVGDGVTSYSDVEISGLIIDANSEANFGVRLHADNGSLNTVVVSRNIFKNADQNGLSVESATNTKIFGNHFDGGNTGLYFESVSRCSAVDNTFIGQTNRAIYVFASEVAIIGNEITGTGKAGAGKGIHTLEASRVRIEGNMIKDANVGITLQNAGGATTPMTGIIVIGNVILNPTIGIQQQRYMDGTKIIGNHIHTATTGISISTFGEANNKNHVIRDNTLIGDNDGASIGILINAGTGMSYGQNRIQNFTTAESFTNNPTWTNRQLESIFSGNNSTTSFTVTHRLAATPKVVMITPTTSGASGAFYVSSTNSTHFTVTYTVAPPSGSSNVKFYWYAAIDNNT